MAKEHMNLPHFLMPSNQKSAAILGTQTVLLHYKSIRTGDPASSCMTAQESDFFKSFDTDGDGVISFGEYQVILMLLALPLEVRVSLGVLLTGINLLCVSLSTLLAQCCIVLGCAGVCMQLQACACNSMPGCTHLALCVEGNCRDLALCECRTWAPYSPCSTRTTAAPSLSRSGRRSPARCRRASSGCPPCTARAPGCTPGVRLPPLHALHACLLSACTFPNAWLSHRWCTLCMMRQYVSCPSPL